MNETPDLVHVDLFSGIGGFALACLWLGIPTICFVEIDKYCQKVLRKHWPNVPIVEDIRDVEKIKSIVANAASQRCLTGSGDRQGGHIQANIGIASQGKSQGQRWLSETGTASSNGTFDKRITTNNQPALLITAGFPCQPFSVAGKQLSQADDRYLWPQTIAVIKEVKPQWVLLENVTGIINLALDEVLSDLEGAGYSTETLIIPACAVNAWHRRDRVWVVANSIGTEGRSGPRRVTIRTEDKGWQPTKDGGTTLCPTGQSMQLNSVADTTNRFPQSRGPQCDVGGLEDQILRGCGDPDYWAVEPELGRVAHGIPARVDRLKCLGNAIVPQVAYEIIKVIKSMTGGVDGL